INERATELRWQLLLRADLGSHVGRECGHVARVAASGRSGHRRIVWDLWIDLTGPDRHPRPHRLLQNRILFGRSGCAGWDARWHAVVRLVVVTALLRCVAVTPLPPIAIGASGPVSPVGWLVGLRSRGSTRWERTAFQIVNHVIVVIFIDDRRKRTITLPRIIA